MRHWKELLLSMLVLVLAGAALAQDEVPYVRDLVGAPGYATDGLEERGYRFVRGDKSGDSSYTYWTEERTGNCVTVRVADGRIASIVYAPAFDCGHGETVGAEEHKFDSICGVIVGGNTFRDRCEVVETESAGGKRVTILRYPDIEFTLHWHREGHVGVSTEGAATVQTTYSTSEGETDFIMDGKTYFYISDKNAAEWEVRNFRD